MAKDHEAGFGDSRLARWTIYASVFAAVVAAIAAVAVAVISSNSNAADTQRRIDHEKEVARSQTVGAARLLAKELATVEVYMAGMLEVNRLIPYDEKYNVQLTQDDQKRIAAAPEIGVDGWQRVAAALSNLDSLEPYVRREYRRGVRRLHPGNVAVFEMQRKAIDAAWAALDPLSGTPKLRNDPFGSG